MKKLISIGKAIEFIESIPKKFWNADLREHFDFLIIQKAKHDTDKILIENTYTVLENAAKCKVESIIHEILEKC